jgi:hypothetical protein
MKFFSYSLRHWMLWIWLHGLLRIQTEVIFGNQFLFIAMHWFQQKVFRSTSCDDSEAKMIP